MNTSRRPATLADVATAAGVHPSTASRALGAGTGISPRTVERVRAVAGDLGYRPDPAASSLRTRRSGLIGVLVPRLTDIVLATIYEGLDAAAAEAGYQTFVANTSDDPEVRRRRLRALLDRRVDGLVLGDARLDDDLLPEIAARDCPTSWSPAAAAATCPSRPTTSPAAASPRATCWSWGTAASGSSPVSRSPARASSAPRGSGRSSRRPATRSPTTSWSPAATTSRAVTRRR